MPRAPLLAVSIELVLVGNDTFNRVQVTYIPTGTVTQRDYALGALSVPDMISDILHHAGIPVNPTL